MSGRGKPRLQHRLPRALVMAAPELSWILYARCLCVAQVCTFQIEWFLCRAPCQTPNGLGALTLHSSCTVCRRLCAFDSVIVGGGSHCSSRSRNALEPAACPRARMPLRRAPQMSHVQQAPKPTVEAVQVRVLTKAGAQIQEEIGASKVRRPRPPRS
jgi:hypothetical protein